MKRLSRSQFIAFSLVFQKFLRNTVSAFSNRSDQFYRKKPLGEILLKVNLKLDGDVMVIFEPGEYMKMFFSVSDTGGSKGKNTSNKSRTHNFLVTGVQNLH